MEWISSLSLDKSVNNLIDIIHAFWNKMTKEQRLGFLKESDLDEIVDESKYWLELDDVQKFAIVSWFCARLGISCKGNGV